MAAKTSKRVVVWTAIPPELDAFLVERAAAEMSTKAGIIRNLVRRAKDQRDRRQTPCKI